MGLFSGLLSNVGSAAALQAQRHGDFSCQSTSSKRASQTQGDSSNSKRVYDAQGQAQPLGQALARGGEGTVYPLQQHPEWLVKRYHPEVLAKRGDGLRRKVEAQIALKPNFQKDLPAWPRLSVFDASGRWVGYAMHRVEGVPFIKLAHAMAYRRHFPDLDRPKLVDYLLRLLYLVDRLHRQGVFIGDYNLSNILCVPGSTSKVHLIDCDSYQVICGNTWFPCPVGALDMTPPEHHDRPFVDIRRTLESERFSIAIVLFKGLMLGRHPYDAVDAGDPVTNIRGGRFPYGKNSQARLPPGPWYIIWSHLPYRLKALFITTFRDGASNPSQRSGLAEWINAFKEYRWRMGKGQFETALIPKAPKPNRKRW